MIPDDPDETDNKPFFSLRWKVILLLSLVLVVVNATLGTLAYWQSSKQFEIDRAQVKQTQNREITELFAQAFRDMSGFSGMIPLLESGLQDASFDARLGRVLERHGAMLALEWGIESVHMYSPEGELQFAWPENTEPLPGSLDIAHTLKFELEQSALFCEPDCRFYMASPVLHQGQFAGVMVLSQSTANAFVELHKLTGAYVAVLQSYFFQGARDMDGLSLPLWRENIPVITDPDRTFPLLEMISRELNRDDVLDESRVLKYEDQWLEVFQADFVFEGSRLLVINEVTAVKAAIEDILRNSVYMGVSGLLLSGLLLFIVLQGPMRRLSRLAVNMPLLAENEFGSLNRGLVETHGDFHRSDDEIDVVEKSVREVSMRLEVAQKAREAAQNSLGWLVEHDPLTRLPNRSGFQREFEKLLKLAMRYQHTGALLIFDIDQFKEVNDISGHPVGDDMLREVARSLEPLVRDTDLLARVGGDAFAMVLPQADTEQAVSLAERIQDRMATIEVHGRDRRHRVSVSIGLVMFPSQGDSSLDLVVSAELAMFQAKAEGHSGWHMFSVDEQAKEQMNARVLWKEQIDTALENDGFELYFQPIAEVSTGNVVRSEVLLRMRGAGGEAISPGEFIPVAEQTGQIAAIDYWVLEKAIGILAENPAMPLSVNLSGRAMADPRLPEKLANMFARHEAAPRGLMLEVTETVALIDLGMVARSMHDIIDLGCHFAIDDFGTGYATYGYLRELPVDVVKIDGSFIQKLHDSPQDRLFVEAIVYITRGLGKKTVAEYVEDQRVLDILTEIGVDYAQGALIGEADSGVPEPNHAEPP